MEEGGNGPKDQRRKRALIVVFSYHHRNTEKVARAMAKVLDARIRTPQEVNPDELPGYDLVGFGSGIYSEQHHESLLDLADRLPNVPDKEAFLFSTCGVPEVGMSRELARKNHLPLRERLEAKGYRIIDEFSCVGWNTNSFLRLFGGINKGRPDAKDLERAEEFACKLRSGL